MISFGADAAPVPAPASAADVAAQAQWNADVAAGAKLATKKPIFDTPMRVAALPLFAAAVAGGIGGYVAPKGKGLEWGFGTALVASLVFGVAQGYQLGLLVYGSDLQKTLFAGGGQ